MRKIEQCELYAVSYLPKTLVPKEKVYGLILKHVILEHVDINSKDVYSS